MNGDENTNEKDGKKLVHKDLITQYLAVYNSKFGGGRMYLNPLGIINDGYFELGFIKNLIGFGPITKMFDEVKSGGI